MEDFFKAIKKVDWIDLIQWCYQNNIPIPAQISLKGIRRFNRKSNGLQKLFGTMVVQDSMETYVAFMLGGVRPEFISQAYNFEKNEHNGQYWISHSTLYPWDKSTKGTIFFLNTEMAMELLKKPVYAAWRHDYHLDRGTKANKEMEEKVAKVQ